MKARARLLGLGLALLSAAAGCAPRPMMAGTLTSRGGELGDFVFAVDRCEARPDLGAFDLRDSRIPGVVLRVVRPGTPETVVVLANGASPGGPRELSFAPGPGCTLHAGYHALVYGDRGFGIRMDCTTAGGGRVSGTAGAGACE